MFKILTGLLLATSLVLTGCASDADRVSQNLKTSADNFEVNRRVVFYNSITDTYLLTIEGLCSIDSSENNGKKLMVTCKVGSNEYKKHFLGLSDNVTYVAEQIDSVKASPYHYRVIFKPQNAVPDLELKVN